MGRIDFTELATNPRNIILFKALPRPEQRFEYLRKAITPHDVRKLKALTYNSFLHTLYWNVVKEYEIVFAGEKCQLCGSTKDLNVHHRNYTYQGEEFRAMDCLAVLCRGCHSLGHHLANAKTQVEIVEAMTTGLSDDKHTSKLTRGKINRSYDPRAMIDLKTHGSIMGYQGGEGVCDSDH